MGGSTPHADRSRCVPLAGPHAVTTMSTTQAPGEGGAPVGGDVVSRAEENTEERRRKHREAVRRHDAGNRAAHRRRQRRWQVKNPVRERERRRLALYGITGAEFDALMQAVGGQCPICKIHPATVLDHDHVRGWVRGPMCARCNSMLGFAQDDPVRLRRAAAWLELFQ